MVELRTERVGAKVISLVIVETGVSMLVCLVPVSIVLESFVLVKLDSCDIDTLGVSVMAVPPPA
jgi:hypothetical protein